MLFKLNLRRRQPRGEIFRNGSPSSQSSLSKALIYESELELISRWVMDYTHLETGGDLFGFWTHSGYPVVHYVIGPGRSARRTATSFYQDREHLIRAGEILRSTHALQHIGEWHSHHRLALAEPSHGDIQTVRRALEHHGISRFLLAICNIEGTSRNDQARVSSFLFSRDRAHQLNSCAWVVLRGKSPIRQALESEDVHISDQPRCESSSYELGGMTRLEDGPAGPPVAAELPSDSWLKTTEGKKKLQKIVASLETKAGAVRILLREDGRIVLSFPYRKEDCEVIFPKDFPHSEPLVYSAPRGNGTLTRLVAREARWDQEDDTCSFILHVLDSGSFTGPLEKEGF